MNERVNAFGRLDYVDPNAFLLRLDAVDRLVSRSQLPREVRTLRTNELKPWREARGGSENFVVAGARVGFRTPLISLMSS